MYYISLNRVSINTFPDLEQIYGLTRTMNAFSAVTSTVLSGCLIFLLNRFRTGIKDTETIIDRLIAFMLGTGLLTTMVAVSCLITVSSLMLSNSHMQCFIEIVCMGADHATSYFSNIYRVVLFNNKA